MARMRIEKRRDGQLTHTLTRVLSVALGLMTLAIIFISHDNPSITGGAVFDNVYGSASPFVILFVLMVVIYLYMRLR
jgi:uncharacterized membrane protein YphA (DoxX/SURF4 family)